jgi:hypothetical protein
MCMHACMCVCVCVCVCLCVCVVSVCLCWWHLGVESAPPPKSRPSDTRRSSCAPPRCCAPRRGVGFHGSSSESAVMPCTWPAEEAGLSATCAAPLRMHVYHVSSKPYCSRYSEDQRDCRSASAQGGENDLVAAGTCEGSTSLRRRCSTKGDCGRGRSDCCLPNIAVTKSNRNTTVCDTASKAAQKSNPPADSPFPHLYACTDPSKSLNTKTEILLHHNNANKS